MLSDASDVLALEDELRTCEKRRCDFSEMLRLANEYHLNERYPDLGSHLLGEVEMSSRRYHALIMSAAIPPTPPACAAKPTQPGSDTQNRDFRDRRQANPG